MHNHQELIHAEFDRLLTEECVMKRVIVSAGLIRAPHDHPQAGKILMSRRLEGVHLAGSWEFPGGKLEEGEEVENCLRRELFEEIGVIAKRYSFFDSYDFKYPTKNI